MKLDIIEPIIYNARNRRKIGISLFSCLRMRHENILKQKGKSNMDQTNASVQKLTWRQWTAISICSYCGALALSMRFAMPELLPDQQAHAVTEIIWNLRNSLSGTSVNSTLFFALLVGLGVLACRMKRSEKVPRLLLPVSFLIALVWLMGASFSINNTLEALNASPGQVVKSICYVLGVTYLLYQLGQLLFCFLEGQKPAMPKGQSRLARKYEADPFEVSFFAIVLCWMPHIFACYPGHMSWDAWEQLAQFYGAIPFTAHHPPAHTLLLASFIEFGVRIGSGNMGLYWSIVMQTLIEAAVLAYGFLLMKRWRTPVWLRIGSFCVVILVPYYTGFVTLVLKDNFYSACFVLFVLEIICMLEEGTDYFNCWSHRFLLMFAIMGTLLFRKNGKYVLYPFIVILLIFFFSPKRDKVSSKGVANMALWLLLPVLLANVFTVAVTAHYGIEKGSIREALSLPFQQTARYVLEYGDEVTEEEAEAIRALLDYENLAEKYDPRISDPVKGTYKNGATKRDLLRYFSVWFKMFLKHPEVYVKATMNQNYYLLYPFTENIGITNTATTGYAKVINGELGITNLESMQAIKTVFNGFYKTQFSLPVVGMLSNQAPYILLLLSLTVFALYKRAWGWLMAAIPIVLSVAVIVLAPVIQNDPRYAFPIIYAMPAMLAYYIHLRQRDQGKHPAQT